MERTTNLSLKKPGLDDDALISDLNDNFETLDSKIGPVGNASLQTQITDEATARAQADTSLNDNITKLQEGIAIIVTGDTASVAVPVSGYAYIKDNTHGLANGLYKNTGSSAFPVNGSTADSTVFTAVPTGAVNDLNSNVTTQFNNKLGGVGIRHESQVLTFTAGTGVIVETTIPAGFTRVCGIQISDNGLGVHATFGYGRASNNQFVVESNKTFSGGCDIIWFFI